MSRALAPKGPLHDHHLGQHGPDRREIDVVINRTLVWGALTGTIALVYGGTVLLSQRLLAVVADTRSDLIVVGSTLVIAVLFQPLRARLQTAIDRRFYRRQYDAARALAEFGIAARDQVDLTRLSADLRQVVDDTLQPTFISLWLRSPVQRTREPDAPTHDTSGRW